MGTRLHAAGESLNLFYLVVTQMARFVLHCIKNVMHSIPFHSILFHSHHSAAWSQCCSCTEQLLIQLVKVRMLSL